MSKPPCPRSCHRRQFLLRYRRPSMPLAPLEQAPTSLTIPVAGGCGPGFHRGPYGGCRRNGYYGGAYYGGGAVVVPGVAVVPPVVVAPMCRRVCNPYRCWTAC